MGLASCPTDAHTWREGLSIRRGVASTRTRIGSSYGYGAKGNGPIPGNATLVFDIELKGVK